jgi:hypothetical protein
MVESHTIIGISNELYRISENFPSFIAHREGRVHNRKETLFISKIPVPAAVVICSWFSMAKEKSKDAPQNGERSENVGIVCQSEIVQNHLQRKMMNSK